MVSLPPVPLDKAAGERTFFNSSLSDDISKYYKLEFSSSFLIIIVYHHTDTSTGSPVVNELSIPVPEQESLNVQNINLQESLGLKTVMVDNEDRTSIPSPSSEQIGI